MIVWGQDLVREQMSKISYVDFGNDGVGTRAPSHAKPAAPVTHTADRGVPPRVDTARSGLGTKRAAVPRSTFLVIGWLAAIVFVVAAATFFVVVSILSRLD